tara:strand:+ start:39 stop:266 length:228 start_codon:yes stop_codon:yes gene_type:complete
LPLLKTVIKKGYKIIKLMTISHNPVEKISLTMKSEGHYKKAAETYRKSKQYNNMINLYPVLQNTIIDCKDENLIE